MSLGRYLSRTTRKLRHRADFQKRVEMFGLKDIRPIGNMRGNLITNKAGRAVLRARKRGRTVKLYEAFSAKHAQFIAAVSASLPDLFPAVLELRGAWIVAEWVEGEPLTSGDIVEQQAHALRRIHALPLDGLPPTDFCYLRNFIFPRFQRVSALSGELCDLDDCLTRAESETEARVVMHPDVSPDNLIRTAGGGIVCIDNELLCVGRMPILDLCNAMRPNPKGLRKMFAQHWFGTQRIEPLMLEQLAQAWIMREVGAAFIGGDMLRCKALLAAQASEAERHLPFADIWMGP